MLSFYKIASREHCTVPRYRRVSDQPSASGLLDFDYPSLADPNIGLGSVKELSDVRKVPLPAELVEQFGRILP